MMRLNFSLVELKEMIGLDKLRNFMQKNLAKIRRDF